MSTTNIHINNNNGNVSAFLRKYKLYKAMVELPPMESTTSGSLVIGATYNVYTPQFGDDFTNVGGHLIADNTDYFTFVATGTTPDVWANGSELKRVILPTVTVLENDLGGDIDYVANQASPTSLILVSNGLFTEGKTIVKGDITNGWAPIEKPVNSNEIKILGDQWRGGFMSYIQIEVYP